MTPEQLAIHLTTLRIACEPDSPFYRQVNFGSDDALLTLSVEEQHQVFNAIPPDLMALVNHAGLPIRVPADEGSEAQKVRVAAKVAAERKRIKAGGDHRPMWYTIALKENEGGN
jgi:hypothetical protein